MFKKMKIKQEEENRRATNWIKTKEMFFKKVYELTGIDLGAPVDPPKFVKESPLLLSLFLMSKNLKYYLLVGFLLYIVGNY